MKYLILIGVLAFVSCKKKYTCSCKNSAGEQGQVTNLKPSTKNAADRFCDEQNNIYSAIGYTCSLN